MTEIIKDPFDRKPSSSFNAKSNVKKNQGASITQ